MVQTQTIPATKITLYDLERQFQLEHVQDASFFEEWRVGHSPLSDADRQRLERVQLSVANLERRSLLENTVKLAVLAPLMDLAGLFLPPFYVSTEESVSIQADDDGLTIQGRIDILVIIEKLWLLVIESKRAEFSPKVGIPQALSYMLAAPQKTRPLYGLVTNGTDFIFLKMTKTEEGPRYGRSRQFVLGQDNDLQQVLQILRYLASLVAKDNP